MSKVEVKTRDDLSTAYTPGVAEPCRKIKENPDDVYKYTFKSNMVAVVSNGTAVLGLGDIGPEAGLRSWRARLCCSRSSAAWTLPHLHRRPRRGQRHRGLQGHCPHLRRHQPRRHQEPECFEIEETLERELDIPVFHDDQHGTAIVVTAASSTPCAWWARRWRTSTSS